MPKKHKARSSSLPPHFATHQTSILHFHISAEMSCKRLLPYCPVDSQWFKSQRTVASGQSLLLDTPPELLFNILSNLTDLRDIATLACIPELREKLHPLIRLVANDLDQTLIWLAFRGFPHFKIRTPCTDFCINIIVVHERQLTRTGVFHRNFRSQKNVRNFIFVRGLCRISEGEDAQGNLGTDKAFLDMLRDSRCTTISETPQLDVLGTFVPTSSRLVLPSNCSVSLTAPTLDHEMSSGERHRVRSLTFKQPPASWQHAPIDFSYLRTLQLDFTSFENRNEGTPIGQPATYFVVEGLHLRNATRVQISNAHCVRDISLPNVTYMDLGITCLTDQPSLVVPISCGIDAPKCKEFNFCITSCHLPIMTLTQDDFEDFNRKKNSYVKTATTPELLLPTLTGLNFPNCETMLLNWKLTDRSRLRTDIDYYYVDLEETFGIDDQEMARIHNQRGHDDVDGLPSYGYSTDWVSSETERSLEENPRSFENSGAPPRELHRFVRGVPLASHTMTDSSLFEVPYLFDDSQCKRLEQMEVKVRKNPHTNFNADLIVPMYEFSSLSSLSLVYTASGIDVSIPDSIMMESISAPVLKRLMVTAKPEGIEIRLHKLHTIEVKFDLVKILKRFESSLTELVIDAVPDLCFLFDNESTKAPEMSKLKEVHLICLSTLSVADIVGCFHNGCPSLESLSVTNVYKSIHQILTSSEELNRICNAVSTFLGSTLRSFELRYRGVRFTDHSDVTPHRKCASLQDRACCVIVGPFPAMTLLKLAGFLSTSVVNCPLLKVVHTKPFDDHDDSQWPTDYGVHCENPIIWKIRDPADFLPLSALKLTI